MPVRRVRSRSAHSIDFIAAHTREERRRAGTLESAVIFGGIGAVLYAVVHAGAPEVFGGLTLLGVLSYGAGKAGKFYGRANARGGDPR